MSGGQRESTSKAGCSRSAGRLSGQIVDSHQNSKGGKKSRMLHLKLFGGEVVIEQLQVPGQEESDQTLTCAQAQAAQTSTGVAMSSNACLQSPLPYVLFSSGRSSAVITPVLRLKICEPPRLRSPSDGLLIRARRDPCATPFSRSDVLKKSAQKPKGKTSWNNRWSSPEIITPPSVVGTAASRRR